MLLSATTGAALALTAGASGGGPVWYPACVRECGPTTGVAAGPDAPAAVPGVPAGTPRRVRVPRLGIDSPLAVLGLDGTGELIPPDRYDQAGWYGGGPAPGDVGPAVIAGHVDSTDGPAVFARLGELRPGDRIEVQRGTGTVVFLVRSVARYAKDRFPTAEVYGPTPQAELRLITCGGTFDRRSRHYRDNVVAFATAAPQPAFPGAAGPG
ncbi:class F sortase [Plantactinospora siamensis]|uniref:class F sortase n=1 Tax=Plantactinospora siamensis TaxID=555372 RepID=UPI0035E51E76